MPQTDPIADAFGIPVTEGAEAQLTKAAEAEASGKKRNAEDLGQSYRPKPFLPEQKAGVAGGQPLAPLANGSAQKKPRHTLALPVLMEEEDSDDEDDSDGDLGSPCPMPKHGEPAKQPAAAGGEGGSSGAPPPAQPAKQPAEDGGEGGSSVAPPPAQQPDAQTGLLATKIDPLRYNAVHCTHDGPAKGALVRSHNANCKDDYRKAARRNEK